MKRLFFIAVILTVQYLSGTAYIFAQDESIQKDYDAHTYYTYAERYYDYGYFDIAISYIDKLQTSQDATMRSSAYRLKALCHIEMGNLEAARKDVSDLLATDPYFSPSASDNPIFLNLVNTNKKTGGTTITTASQQAETLEEAPVPVTLITEEMIKACGARTLKEALIAYVPGMTDVATNDEMNIAMRGVYSSYQEKILFLLNGHRMNSYSTNAASPDFSMSLEKVKQIEVLRGPASSIYGGVALTAVVNIITKGGNDIDGAIVKAATGNYGQISGDFLFGKNYAGLSVTAWGSMYNSTGEKYHIDGTPEAQPYSVLPVAGDVIIGAYNKKPSHDFGVNIRYKEFYILFNHRFAKTVSPMALSVAFTPYSYDKYMKWYGNAPGNAVTSQHIEFGYNHTYKNLSFDAAAYYDKQSQQRFQVLGDTIMDFGDLITIFPYYSDHPIKMERGAIQSVNWDEFTLGGKLTGSLKYKFSNTQTGNIMLGGEFYCFNLYDATYFEGINYCEPIKVFHDEKMLLTGREMNFDAFFQIKHQFGKLFTANAGIRYDHKKRRMGKKIDELSPRLAIIYNNPLFNMKLSYSHSFVDAPYFYRSNSLDVEYGSEDLLPEKQNSFQLSFYSDNKIAKGLTIDANVFYNRTTDAIVFESTTSTASNDANMSTVGGELVARYKVNRFTSEINMTYQYVTAGNFSVLNHRALNIPNFNTNVILSYDILKNLNIHANARYVGRQNCLFLDALNEDPEYTGTQIDVPARCIFGLGIRYKYKKLEVSGDAHNLFNHRYSQGGSTVAPIVQPGTWINASVGYKF